MLFLLLVGSLVRKAVHWDCSALHGQNDMDVKTEINWVKVLSTVGSMSTTVVKRWMFVFIAFLCSKKQAVVNDVGMSWKNPLRKGRKVDRCEGVSDSTFLKEDLSASQILLNSCSDTWLDNYGNFWISGFTQFWGFVAGFEISVPKLPWLPWDSMPAFAVYYKVWSCCE